jgi:mRNA-degrading endonuclease RelE of RelBE toxin-antitoxin system
MNLVMARSARRGVSAMTPKARAALLRRLEAIALRPFGEHANVTALKGAPDLFRLRQGDWRAVYVVDREAQEVQVLDVAPRGSVYR